MRANLKTRLRSWKTILVTGLKSTQLEIWNKWRESGLWIGKGRYRVRESENTSSQGIARILIRAVLKNPSDAENVEVVKEVINELVKYGKRQLIRSKGKFLDKGIPWPKQPHYIFIYLFRVDGTLRWLKGGGWIEGNLVAVAEWTRGKHSPVLIDNPEETYKGIRIRHTMDKEKAKQARDKLAEVISDINRKRNQ